MERPLVRPGAARSKLLLLRPPRAIRSRRRHQNSKLASNAETYDDVPAREVGKANALRQLPVAAENTQAFAAGRTCPNPTAARSHNRKHRPADIRDRAGSTSDNP